MPLQTLRLHPNDNVAIAHAPIAKGTLLIEQNNIEVIDDIPAMHKLAIKAIARGESIRKFDQVIGVASADISSGQQVHSHNCQTTEHLQQAITNLTIKQQSLATPQNPKTFMGYERDDGRVGTRNYIGILTTVNCSATVAHKITQQCNLSAQLDDYPNIDGLVALSHKSGCGMSNHGEGFDCLSRTLKGYARHANFGGILLIGLGCEVMQLRQLMSDAAFDEGPLLRTLIIQEAGGTTPAIQQGIDIIQAMLPIVGAAKRSRQPASKLTLALQCGGSDALSGITANPALGIATDILVEQGGTAILAETPEMYGAEHLLLSRAINTQVVQKFQSLISWWENYAQSHSVSLDNNPSPGNKVGGLTTILEKSLGAQAKGGHSPLTAVYDYAETISEKGLVFMNSPGFDSVSVTGQVAAGANIVCFTTGRGSAFGFKPVPVIKLGSNSALMSAMSDDIDINCGLILDGDQSVQQCGQNIFERILSIASGEKSCSEIQGYGDHEFSPWQIGAVL